MFNLDLDTEERDLRQKIHYSAEAVGAGAGSAVDALNRMEILDLIVRFLFSRVSIGSGSINARISPPFIFRTFGESLGIALLKAIYLGYSSSVSITKQGSVPKAA